MTCKIIFGKKDDGSIDKSIIQEVKAPNGKRSLLFDTIRDDVKENTTALNQYALTYTDEFKQWSVNKLKDENNEVSYDTLNEYTQPLASQNPGANKFNLFSSEEYSKDSRKYIEEVDRVTRLIENKLKIKERPFRGKTSDKFIEKKDYLDDVFKKLLNNIGLPDSITTMEELKYSLDNGDALNYIQKQYDLSKEQSIETKNNLDILNSNITILNGFLKSNNINDYPKDKHDLIKKAFPALFGELGRYKSKSQALGHYKQIVNTNNFLNKNLNLDNIKRSYFMSQGRLSKFENLLNYNTLAPDDFKNRIYTVIENELNRRSEFFTTPKMQTVVLAEKERIAQRNYERSAKGLLEKLSNNTNTISGKISNLFLQHPKTLSAISAQHINKNMFGFAGGEWKGDGTLVVNYKDETSLRHILLHELTHHFTVPYVIAYLKKHSNVSKYEGFVERFPSKEDLAEEIQYSFDSLTKEEIDSISKLEDIYIHILKLHKEGKIEFTNKQFSSNPEYGLENLYEFLSEVISNPYFAAEIAKQPSIYNKKSNLLKDIIDMIYKMFGVTNISLLDDVYTLFEESFLNKDSKYTFKDISTPDVTFNYNDIPLQNPVSDQNEQDAEIRNGFRKPNRQRPQLTWNEAFKLSKAFNTDTTGKYSDNKNYKAKVVQYEVDKVTKKTAYRVSLNRIDNGIATETPGGPTDTRVKDRITSAYYPNGMKSKRAADVVEEIANSDHGLNKLAKTLLPFVKYNNVFINLSEGKKEFIKANGEKTTAAGMYYPGSNDVTMYVNEKYNPLFVEKVLLHEVLHAITWNQLRRGNQSSRDFNALYEYAKEQIPNWENTYAMSDADEFMVALFTDSEFMKTLSNIPPMSGIKEYKNLLQEIFDYFLSLINITKSDPTLYSQAFAVATNVLEDFKQESEMKEVFNEMQDSYYDNYEPVEPPSNLFADNKSGDLMYSINEMKRLLSDKKTLSNYKMYDFKSTDEIQNEIDEESNTVEYYYNSGNTVLLEESRENISDLKKIYELFEDIEIIVDRGLKLSTLSQEEKNNLELLTQSDNIELGLEILIGNLESQLDNGVASVVDDYFENKRDLYAEIDHRSLDLTNYDNDIENGLSILESLNNINDDYKYYILVSLNKATNYRSAPVYVFINDNTGDQIAFYKKPDDSFEILPNTKINTILNGDPSTFEFKEYDKQKTGIVDYIKNKTKELIDPLIIRKEKHSLAADNSILSKISEEKGLDWDMVKSMLMSKDNTNQVLLKDILSSILFPEDDSQYKKIDATDINNVNAFNKEAYDEYYKTNRIGTGIIESNLIFSNINEDEKGRLFSSHLDSTIELQKKKIADRYTTTREKERLEVENNFYNQMKSIINLLSLVEDKKLQYKLYELLSSPDIENFSVAQSILPGLATEGSEMKKIDNITFQQPSTNQEQKQAYKETLDKLSARFGIKYTIINNPNAKWVGRYKPDGTIEINEAFIDQYPDAPFHEFFHPFLDVIEKNNVKLFNALKQEIDSLLMSTDPKDANLKTLLRRILNDKDYTNPDGTLNALGYKEAITELVGAHALKSHNDEWRRRIKEVNPKWEQTGWDAAVEGPGMSEARHKKVDSLMKQLWNYIRNVVAKILRPSDPSDTSGYSSGNIPLLPSELNPNMTLSDLGYLMGQGTSPVKLDIDASRDMPVQYKKFSDTEWISPDAYAGDNYSDEQRKFIAKYNQVNENLDDTDNKATVKVTDLSDKKKAELLGKKQDELSLYKLRTPNKKGRAYVENRITMAQDLKFLKRTKKTKEEFKAEENAAGSVIAREFGTKLHSVNEGILERLLELDGNLNMDTTMSGSDWANKTLDEVIKNDAMYLTYVEEIKKNKTPFIYDERTSGAYALDDDGNIEYDTTVSRDATRSYDEMIRSMLRLYHEVYSIQNRINPKKKPMFLLEKPLYDEKNDTAGATDFMVIFSDSTALIYDHKFINFKHNKVTFTQYKSRPENAGKSDAELLNEIYNKRERQGYGSERYAPTTKYPDGNQYFFEIDDSNIDALYRWKQDSYETQLSQYADILRDLYGVKRMRQVRVIPNAVSYNRIMKKDLAGKDTDEVDLEKSKLQFLMTGSGDHSLLKQLPTKGELTDDKRMNDFIKKLEDEKDKLRKQLDKKGWDSNLPLVDRFTKISNAIVALKVEDGLMNVIDLISSLVNDITYRLSEDEFELDVDGLTTEIPNPRFLTLKAINDYNQELKLYSTFADATYKHIKTLKEKEKDGDNGLFKKFLTAYNNSMGSITLIERTLQQESLNRLAEINEKHKLMTKEKFESYTQQADINGAERYFTHLANVRHPLVNMFKQLHDKVVYNRMQYQKELIAKVEKINKPLEDWAKSRGISIYKAYEMMLNKDKNLVGKWNKSYYDEFEKHRNKENADVEWYKKNFKRSDEQEAYFADKKAKVITWYKDKFGIEMWEEQFEKWLNKNDITYNNGNNQAWLFIEPARDVEPVSPDQYYDERYKVIMNTKPLKDFYDFYRKQNVEMSKMVDFKITSNFVAEIYKDSIDVMVQNGLSGTKMAMDAYNNLKNSLRFDKDRDMINVDDKIVPVMFTDSIRAEDKSVDLAKSLVIFGTYVSEYSGLKELESITLSLRNLVANTDLVKVDTKGNKVRMPGSAQFETITKDNKQILALFDSMINHYIYGESMNTDIGVDPQVAKVITKAVELNAKKNIAMNLTSATAGHLGSIAQMNKVAKESKYFTSKQLHEARTSLGRFNAKALFAYEYFKIEQEDLTTERAGQINKSILRNKYTKGGAYMLQRRSEDILNHTILLAMMSNYSIDPMTNKAERIDFLKEKYKDRPDSEYSGKDYKWLSLHEMIEMGAEAGNMINPYTKKEFGFDEFNSFRKKVLEIAKKTRGSSSDDDIAAYKTTLVGKVLMQFKNWMPNMIRDRVKKQQYDVAMEEFEVGSWVGMWNVLKEGKANAFGQLMANMIPFVGTKFSFLETSEVFNSLFEKWKANNPEDFAEMMNKFGLNPDNDGDYEKANELVKKQFITEYANKVKGTAKEFQMYLMFMMLMLIIWWAAGDDEEDKNPLVKGAITVLERAMLEVGFFLPGFDYISTQAIMGQGQFEMGKMIGKSPIPSFGIVMDAFRGVANAGSEAIDLIAGAKSDEYYDMFNIGDKSMSSPFNPEFKKDNAPMGKYVTPYLFSGAKGFTDILGVFDTTEKDDTIWDYVFSTDPAFGKK